MRSEGSSRTRHGEVWSIDNSREGDRRRIGVETTELGKRRIIIKHPKPPAGETKAEKEKKIVVKPSRAPPPLRPLKTDPDHAISHTLNLDGRREVSRLLSRRRHKRWRMRVWIPPPPPVPLDTPLPPPVELPDAASTPGETWQPIWDLIDS